jgi:hypothetical protein
MRPVAKLNDELNEVLASVGLTSWIFGTRASDTVGRHDVRGTAAATSVGCRVLDGYGFRCRRFTMK